MDNIPSEENLWQKMEKKPIGFFKLLQYLHLVVTTSIIPAMKKVIKMKNVSILLDEKHVRFLEYMHINRSSFIRDLISKSDFYQQWKKSVEENGRRNIQ